MTKHASALNRTLKILQCCWAFNIGSRSNQNKTRNSKISPLHAFRVIDISWSTFISFKYSDSFVVTAAHEFFTSRWIVDIHTMTYYTKTPRINLHSANVIFMYIEGTPHFTHIECIQVVILICLHTESKRYGARLFSKYHCEVKGLSWVPRNGIRSHLPHWAEEVRTIKTRGRHTVMTNLRMGVWERRS